MGDWRQMGRRFREASRSLNLVRRVSRCTSAAELTNPTPSVAAPASTANGSIGAGEPDLD